MNANKQTVTLTVDGGLRQITPGQRLSSYLTGELPCGGHGKCGKCKVIAKGELSAVSQRERELLSEEELARGVRLSCLTEVLGDCLVETDSPPKGRVQILTDSGWRRRIRSRMKLRVVPVSKMSSTRRTCLPFRSRLISRLILILPELVVESP